jgi:two-component system NtrC family sensor kinase
MDQGLNARILVIDDNISIHQDFIKTLTASPSQSKLKSFEEEILNLKDPNEKNILPLYHIDTALQGQEGVKKVALALQENKPYAVAFVDSRMPPGWDGSLPFSRSGNWTPIYNV